MMIVEVYFVQGANTVQILFIIHSMIRNTCASNRNIHQREVHLFSEKGCLDRNTMETSHFLIHSPISVVCYAAVASTTCLWNPILSDPHPRRGTSQVDMILCWTMVFSLGNRAQVWTKCSLLLNIGASYIFTLNRWSEIQPVHLLSEFSCSGIWELINAWNVFTYRQ